MQTTYHLQEEQLQLFEAENGGFESGAINRLATLSLHHSAATNARATPTYGNRCFVCGSSSTTAKRRPPSYSSLQESVPKKQEFATSTPASQTQMTPHVPSPPWPPQSLPVLRRCVSDPVHSLGTVAEGPPSAAFVNPQSPENANRNSSTPTVLSPAKSSALPPLPRVLRRSVSDPTQSPFKEVTATPTPTHAVVITSSQSPNSGELGSESPSSKRLKRMKERMKEMIQWWDEVIREGEGGSEESNDNGEKRNTTENECGGFESGIEEAVGIERTGEGFIIQFKCSCKKGYQILLSGNNCYYKLI